MFGLEALIGKAGAILALILGTLAVLFGAFLKGKSSARKQAELDTLRAAREAQVRVGEAQAKDAGLDEEARKKAEEAKRSPPGGQDGEKYRL
jgi:hypothetical protein